MTSLLTSIIAISSGAAIGAVSRWLLSTHFNALNQYIPYGTLIANWIGAYCIGIALPLLGNLPNIAPEWRLFIITGLLGGLTTFSSFSAESVSLLLDQRWGWALWHISLHLIGSLLLTTLGILTVQLIKNF